MIVVTYTCEHCFQPFERPSKPGGFRFCSPDHANQHAYKLGRGELQQYADIGARIAHIAKRLQVSEHTVRDALKRHGLFRLWYSVRYNRCASPTAGNTSATTASATVNSPSAASVALMAGGTNCGG